MLELQRELRERDSEIEQQRTQIDKLSNERRILLEGETKEKDNGQAREEAWAKERVRVVGIALIPERIRGARERAPSAVSQQGE